MLHGVGRWHLCCLNFTTTATLSPHIAARLLDSVTSNPGLSCRWSHGLGNCSLHTIPLAVPATRMPPGFGKKLPYLWRPTRPLMLQDFTKVSGPPWFQWRPLLSNPQIRGTDYLASPSSALRGLPVLICNLASLGTTPGFRQAEVSLTLSEGRTPFRITPLPIGFSDLM